MKRWQVLWQLVRPRPWLYSTVILLQIVMWVGFLVPGLVAQAFFDDLTNKADSGVLVWLLVLFLMLEVGRVTNVVLWGVVGTTFRHTVGGVLRLDLFAHILARPGARALPSSPGEAVSRFREDVDEIMDFLGLGGVPTLIGMALYTAFSFVIMLRINALVTLLVFVPLVGVTIVAYVGRERITKYRTASRMATAEVTSALGEMFGAVQAVKVATAEERIIGHFESLAAQRRSAALKDLLFGELLSAFFRGSGTVGTGLILLLAARSMQTGAFTVGNLALFAFNAGFITNLIAFVGGLLARWKQIDVSLGRLETLLQGVPLATALSHSAHSLSEPLPGDPPTPLGADQALTTLTARDLTYHYPDSGCGIDSINLCLRQGSFIVVTGRVGSGKTTLLRTLLGLLPRESGEIRWNDEIVGDPGTFLVPPRSAYTPQVPCLFSDTLQENILLGVSVGDGQPASAMHRAVLEEDIQSLTDGLGTLVGPRGVKLSGGQVQRAAAARMFVRDAELMVVDDLSSALDIETERLLWKRLTAHTRATYLVVSHRRAAFARADHIIVLKDGRVEAEGSLEQLMNECDEMRRLWGSKIALETSAG